MDPLRGDPSSPEVRALVALIRPAGAPPRGPWDANVDQLGVDIPLCITENGQHDDEGGEVTGSAA